MQKDIWIKGIPERPEPDRLYAVMAQNDIGVAVGNILRGDDCNWKSCCIIAHYPLPSTLTAMQAASIKRSMFYDFKQYVKIDAPHSYCCWSQNTYDDVDCSLWHTTCGEEFVLTDGSPSDNRMNFCHYCGKPVIESGYHDEEQSEV